MKPSKRLLTTVLTLALGLGVWSLAVSFTNSNFGAGDMLSAAELNNLLNGNFDKAETAIGDLEADVAALETAKFDNSGGAIRGRTSIFAAATSDGTGDPHSVLRVTNTSSDKGSAAVFQSQNSSDTGAVSVKQLGAGPALTLKASGGGPLVTGASGTTVSFIVEDNGSIKIGDMGTAGTKAPALHLNAADGTITNSVGSGLPYAFGTVNSLGVKTGGTDNWTVSREGSTYYIALTGTVYRTSDFATIATPVAAGTHDIVGITTNSSTSPAGSRLSVSPRNSSGDVVQSGFSFTVFKNN
jgi:hypothetical protein